MPVRRSWRPTQPGRSAPGVERVKSGSKTVRVSLNDDQVLAVEEERGADGRVVLFLPGAPGALPAGPFPHDGQARGATTNREGRGTGTRSRQGTGLRHTLASQGCCSSGKPVGR